MVSLSILRSASLALAVLGSAAAVAIPATLPTAAIQNTTLLMTAPCVVDSCRQFWVGSATWVRVRLSTCNRLAAQKINSEISNMGDSPTFWTADDYGKYQTQASFFLPLQANSKVVNTGLSRAGFLTDGTHGC